MIIPPHILKAGRPALLQSHGSFSKVFWAMPVASFVVLPAFHGTSYYIACEEIIPNRNNERDC
jgi:hypothetical protein